MSKINFFIVFFGVLAVLPWSQTVAQDDLTYPTPSEYQLLAPIPINESGCVGSAGETCTTNTAEFLPGLFKLIIMLATGAAVVMIIFAGLKYMSTDAFSGKEEAKGMIENALWGLLLASSAWLILNTINPDLTKINLSLEPQRLGSEIPRPGTLPGLGGGSCSDCEVVGVRHRGAPNGCAAPGPCQVDRTLNARLVALNRAFPIFVTESFPPTLVHQNDCHANGLCVDVQRVADNRVYDLIRAAINANLNPVFEVRTETRKNAVIAASCGTNQTCRSTLGARIAVETRITGEHFSVYRD